MVFRFSASGLKNEHRSEQSHWSECGRATSVDNSEALGCPHRSVPTFLRHSVRGSVILDKMSRRNHAEANAVRPAAQAAAWSGGPYGVGTVRKGRCANPGFSDSTVFGNGCSEIAGSCLKNPAVDLTNVPANRQWTSKAIGTLLPLPLAGTFAGHRSR